MDEKNRKITAIISLIRKFITVFFTIFFNIYVLKIINDIGTILLVNLAGIVFGYIFNVILLKCINNKNAKNIYVGSFVLLIFCIGILLISKENIIKYVYLFSL